VPAPLVKWDLPWETLTGMILWAVLWFGKGKAGKKTAIYLTILYFVYVSMRAIFFGVD
jgi:cation:H+ antiporter